MKWGCLIRYVPAALLGSVMALAVPAGAATIDFASVDDSAPGAGFGNTLSFSAGGISVSLQSFAETGAADSGGFYRFQTAEAYSWSSGLGVCNRREGTGNVTCDQYQHEIDTHDRAELLVLVFDQVVNFESLDIYSWDGPGADPNDRDVTYWVGNLASLPDLGAYSFGTLGGIAGLGAETLLPADSGYGAFTHALAGSGNVLMLAGNVRDRACINSDVTADGECEAYKIAGITVSAVPVPPVAWLLVPAFAAAAARRRKR